MLRLTDSNLSMYIELLKIFTMILSGYRPYTMSSIFAIKRILPSYRPYTKTPKKRRFNCEMQLQKYAYGIFSGFL